MATLDSKIPSGPIQDKWDKHKFDSKLVNPSNRRKFHVVIVGTGLAGGSAAASLAEMGYSVTQVAMRAGHDPSIAAKHYSGRVSETDQPRRRLEHALAVGATTVHCVDQVVQIHWRITARHEAHGEQCAGVDVPVSDHCRDQHQH